MGASYIQLPVDSAGKKLATRQRTIGANTVEEQYVLELTSERVRSGVYFASILSVVQATATNGTTSGFWWLYNPVGSSVLMALRRAVYTCQNGSPATATPTSPRTQLSLFTFTGTPGGAAITTGKADSTYGAAAGILMSTQVTSAVTLGAPIKSFLPAFNQITGSGGPAAATFADWDPASDDGMPLLRAGEGIACWQPDNGSTSDVRRQVLNIAWEEFTIP